jgi:prepilin-type N-terminal cleavage/methylation domain-containing protein
MNGIAHRPLSIAHCPLKGRRTSLANGQWAMGSRQCRGFTFIEILATIAFLAIVLPAVMGGISLSLAAAGMARQQAEASTLAHSKLMELVATGDWQQAEQAGDFSPDWPTYRWTLQVSDYSDGKMQQLDLSVLWDVRGQEHSVTLTTLVYPPGSTITTGVASQ